MQGAPVSLLFPPILSTVPLRIIPLLMFYDMSHFPQDNLPRGKQHVQEPKFPSSSPNIKRHASQTDLIPHVYDVLYCSHRTISQKPHVQGPRVYLLFPPKRATEGGLRALSEAALKSALKSGAFGCPLLDAVKI